MPYKPNKRQIEIPGSWEPLETALEDLSTRMDDLEKAKEAIQPAKERLAEIMLKSGKERISHGGRSFSVRETPSLLKLSVRKEKDA